MQDLLTLKIGERITPLTLSERLFALGFEQNYSASRPGEFMRRGAVINLWPCEYQTPLRLEFDETSLAGISEIDLNGAALVRLQEAVILSQKLHKTLARGKIDLSFIVSLKTGDFVVHRDHGIGIFAGIGTQTIDGASREYFIIEYKDKDRLYAPVELADKIDKYIGTENPKIHRLHGASWQMVTQKIKEDAAKTARELLTIYAQRRVAGARLFPKNLNDIEQGLRASFAYQETSDQERAIEEIYDDLAKETPMDRLVCGDVGFGKTEVAIRAAGKIVSNGCQVGVLAPTTVLAQQHFDTFSERLKQFNIRIGILSRFQNSSNQKITLRKLKTGEIDIIIGTHRLLSDDVVFSNLWLLIIDEEQKFGVSHKEKLKKARQDVHVLALSATPIPRTLNMSLVGLRDISLIATPPKGRLSVETTVSEHDRALIAHALEKEIARGGQAYYLYNKVESIALKAREIQSLVPAARIGIAHGQLKEQELVAVMHAFDTRRIDILVCSTIIENGLDLPNVNTLIVENTPKFGLSQLHQIRGRIGRSNKQAYAYFLYDRLPEQNKGNLTEHSRGVACYTPALKPKEQKRLSALLSAKELGSGFFLAMRDMEIRGIGTILGKKQHGSAGAIGISFYLRILEQTVEEIKTGKIIPPQKDAAIDLPLEYAITKEFEPYEHQRLKIYHELASIKTREELMKKSREFLELSRKERYSKETEEKLRNLFYILNLKLLATTVHIQSINTIRKPSFVWQNEENAEVSKTSNNILDKRLIIAFEGENYCHKLPSLLQANPNWIIGDGQIKIDMEHLWAEWEKEVLNTVTLFL